MLWFHKSAGGWWRNPDGRDKAEGERSCNGNRQARGDRRKRKKLAGLFLSAMAMYLVSGLTPCGGSTKVTKTISPGTPTGTSPITLLSSSGGTSHTASVTITLN